MGVGTEHGTRSVGCVATVAPTHAVVVHHDASIAFKRNAQHMTGATGAQTQLAYVAAADLSYTQSAVATDFKWLHGTTVGTTLKVDTRRRQEYVCLIGCGCSTLARGNTERGIVGNWNEIAAVKSLKRFLIPTAVIGMML